MVTNWLKSCNIIVCNIESVTTTPDLFNFFSHWFEGALVISAHHHNTVWTIGNGGVTVVHDESGLVIISARNPIVRPICSVIEQNPRFHP